MTTDKSLVHFAHAEFPLSKEEYSYETLREAILSGFLSPGVKLNQAALAEALGTSPIPIRAAVQRLIHDGLVSQEPHQSARVSNLSWSDLEEILLIRMHLELLATRTAIPRIKAHNIAELESICDQMSEALTSDELALFGALNKRFHLKLYEACPYPLLNQMILDLWDNSDRFRSRTMFSLIPDLAERSQKDHRSLLELIRSKRVDEAVRLMDEHKTRAREMILEYLKTKSESLEKSSPGEKAVRASG